MKKYIIVIDGSHFVSDGVGFEGYCLTNDINNAKIFTDEDLYMISEAESVPEYFADYFDTDISLITIKPIKLNIEIIK